MWESELVKGRFSCVAFINCLTAFDTVNHEKRLLEKNMSRTFLQFCRELYKKSRNRVKWQNELSQPYDLERGVRQGDLLSAWYFNVYLVGATRAGTGNRDNTIKIGELNLFIPKYVNDVVLISPSAVHLQESGNRLVECFHKNDLIVNVSKSVCMVIEGGHQRRVPPYHRPLSSGYRTDLYTATIRKQSR